MAVSNAEVLDLRIPGKKEALLLFAKNLVDYMLSKHIYNYLKWEPIVFRNYSCPTFLSMIRRTIDFIDHTLDYNHENLASKMQKSNLFNSNSYERFHKILAAKHFPEGFDAKYFFLYCVNVSVMASYFYCAGTLDAPDLAKQYMYQILQKYDVLAGEWNAICKIAENCVKMLRNSMNERTPSDTSSVSDDIEHNEQEQEGVSNDESNSSPSEEESDSSINTGSDTEIQREYARLNIKGYLKLQAKYSSKSESQIGLCSLREPESSCKFERNNATNSSESDDKPRRCTPSVDRELIFIISDFKTKTNMLWNEIQLIDKSASD